MHFGHAPHVPSPDDRTVVSCRCGWFSPEMTKEQFGEFGVPWYCDDCGSIVTRFATFHPRERGDAYDHLIIRLKGETVGQMRDRLLDLLAERGTKVTYSICPNTPTGLHEWERLPVAERMTLDSTDAWAAMNVITPADMKCSQCGKLYSEHVTVEERTHDIGSDNPA